MKAHPLFWPQLTAVAAFMVPGLALWLPSGYSWGAVLLLLCSLATVGTWWRRPAGAARTGAWALVAAITLMGLVWALDVDAGHGLRHLDRASKYLLAVPGLFYLLVYPPPARALWWGLAVGATGSGLLALYQADVLGVGRVAGFTNAIQYGNLSLALGVMCGLVLCAMGGVLRRWAVAGLALGLLLGLLGSLLSMSRGGWLALGLSLPLWLALLWRWGHRRTLWRAAGLCALAAAAALVLQGPELSQRWGTARAEVLDYARHGQAGSSVGQRLDHWRLAWAMGWDKPWTGWGRTGYVLEKQRRVAAGQAHPFVLQFDHGHNEALDLFAKRGLPGVLALLVLYAVPWAIFWPTRRRLAADLHRPEGTALALRLVGLALPVLYLGFGLTQAFLAHNSGNMFYLFMVMLVFAALYAPCAHAPDRGRLRT